MNNFFRRILLSILILIFMSGCFPNNGKPAPKRDFSVFDLLITEDDMPTGWKASSTPRKSIYWDHSPNSAQITFNTDLYPDNGGSIFEVYQYDTGEIAHNDFNELVTEYLNGGRNKIKDWSFISKNANEYMTDCTYMGVEKIPVCNYAARYEEFVFIFECWLIPDRMSLAQMEEVTKKVDQKFSDYLYPPK